jgi:hypothetical protein
VTTQIRLARVGVSCVPKVTTCDSERETELRKQVAHASFVAAAMAGGRQLARLREAVRENFRMELAQRQITP